MGVDRELLRQFGLLIKPLKDRIANTISRGVVHLVDDGKKLQRMQLGGLAGETIDGDGTGAEHFQQYGFSSIPLGGAECVVVFPNGDRSHPLVIATGDRSSRPTGGKGGEVTMYSHTGAKITLLDNGNVHVQAAPGAQVLVDDGSGAAPLVTQAQFMNHTHATAGTGPPTPPTALTPSPALTGTTVIKGK